MLRVIINIITSILLLVSTTGLAVSKHYCADEFISIELNNKTTPCCDDDKCCHTETQLIQVENDFLASDTNFSLEVPFSSDFIPASSKVETKPVNNSFKTSFIHSALQDRCTGTRLALQQVYRL